MDWVTAVANVTLVILTGFYVRLTYKMLQETKRMVDETHVPEVIVSLKFKEAYSEAGHCYFYTFFCVQNVGTRAARKIKFDKGDLSFAPVHGESLSSLKFVKNGIDTLQPGEMVSDKIVAVVGTWSKIFDDDLYKNRESKVDIGVTYQNLRGTEYSDTFSLDFLKSNAPNTQQIDIP